MSAFQAKFKTAESYLAGAGASGALLAGAFIMFVILVGVATFDTWPHATGLLPGGDDGVTLDSTGSGTPVPAHRSGPSPVKLKGTKNPGAKGRGAGGGIGRGERTSDIDGNAGSPGVTGRGETPSGQSGQPSTSPTHNLLQETVSNVGNTVEANATSLGNDLNSTSPGVGGLVSGLGTSVNKTLQGLTGSG
jgi:hypothetical protein